MELHSVLNVQVGAPVTDLGGALKLNDLEDGIVEAVVHGDLLLLLIHKVR